MSGKPFLDTNILVYAFAGNDPRRDRAQAMVAAGGVVNIQVLNEFVNAARRKLKRDWNEVQEALGILKTLLDPPHPLTLAIHERAIRLARDHGFAWYDSLIIAAAGQAGCRLLYSEDMQHGRVIEGLAIHNPFAE